VIVDVHAHFLPSRCLELDQPTSAAAAYTVHITDPHTRESLFRAETTASGFDVEQLHGLERRRRDMLRQGVDLQVLSVPPPFGFFYALEPPTALAICRVLNDAFAETVAADPDHFVALATVPLQAPEVAVTELRRAVTELGLCGVEIGSNVAGRNLDDQGLRPFFAAVQDLDVPLFIHSTNGGALGGGRLARYQLANLIGNPTEDALAAASLIFGGVLEDFPRLKVYLAHAGGSCPYIFGRWEHGWRVRPEARTIIQRPPSAYAGQLMFDSLTHSAAALQFLIDSVGSERVLLGTDYPYDMAEPEPVQRVAQLERLPEAARARVLGDNAARLFRLPVPVP
jgi:aminocarboxymuconate-semialdehyde decarboxylase